MIKCWYCNEEITSGNNPEHIGICDECYKNTFGYGNEFIRNMIIKTTDLKHQLALTEKALELACDDIRFLSKHIKYNLMSEEFVKQREERLKNLENDFKTKAKEMMKSE